jgi:hypothetical protein
MGLSAIAGAQEVKVLFRFDGPAGSDRLGTSVAAAGDTNGDGVPDIIVGAPSASPGGRSAAGSVFVFSGADGRLLHRLDGPAANDQLGVSVAGGVDMAVDADEVPDVIAGAPRPFAPDPGSVLVFSGATGSLLLPVVEPGQSRKNEMGFSVAGSSDTDLLDPLGASVIIVGAPAAVVGGIGVGSAFVVSGANGGLLFRFNGEAAADRLGTSVAAGDVDGDGLQDMIVGAPGASPGRRAAAGSTFVVARRPAGTVLHRFDGEASGDTFGSAVANAGDVNRDGVPDIIVGAPTANPGGRESAGSAFVFSGADGRMLLRFDGATGGPPIFDHLGAAVAGAGDMDGDGVPDLVVGAPGASPGDRFGAGSVFVFSGADGRLLLRFDGEAELDRLGTSVAGAGDLNGDGRAEVIVGAPGAAPEGRAGAGSAFVLSLAGLSREPDIAVEPTAVDFGRVRVGRSKTRVLVIGNDGEADLEISALAGVAPPFRVVSPAFPQTVAPGDELQVTLGFQPTAKGRVTQTLTIESNDPDEPAVEVTLMGQGRR